MINRSTANLLQRPIFESPLVCKFRHARLDILPIPRENLIQNRNKHAN